MDFKTFEQALRPKNSKVQITTQTLNSSWANFLQRYYYKLGETIDIDEAKATVDEQRKTITITGKSNYLNIPNLELEAVFILDEEGFPQACFRYTLIGSTTSSTRWKFSDSFPALPFQVKSNRLSSQGKKSYDAQPYLDDLEFTQAYAFVSTDNTRQEDFGVEIVEGINFVSKIKPLGFLGILQNLLSNIEPVTLYGKIEILADDTQLDMSKLNTDVGQYRMYPWEMDEYPLPGVHLKVDLPLGFKVGKAQLRDTRVNFYVPFSYDWKNKAEIFQPITALAGTLDIPSAEMSVDIISVLDAKNTLFFEGRFDGFSVENIAKLADICGTDITSVIPSTFSKVLKPLKRLELLNLAFRIYWGTKLEVREVMFGIGIPGLDWQVWDDHIVVNDIGCQFILYSPFKRLATDIRLWGKTLVEGAEVGIWASNFGGRLKFMGTVADAPIPLKQLMKTYAPNVPPPSDLTINALRVATYAGETLEMAGSLAEKPQPWELDLGPTKLKIANVQFDFAMQKNSPFQGRFRGELAIGKNIKIATQYAVPGEFTIRGEAERIVFRELLQKLTNQPISLPKDLDFTLLNASVLIKKDTSGLVLQLASQVEKFGFIAFEVKKVTGKWGVAAGVNLDGVKLSSVPGLSSLKSIEKVVNIEDLLLVISTYDGPQFRFPDMAAFANPALGGQNVQLPSTAGGVVNGLNVYCKWKISAKDKKQKLLRAILQLDSTVAVTLQISNPPTQKTSMFTTMETKLNGKWPMKCTVGLALNQGTPEFFAAGNAKVKISGRNYIFDLALSFVTSGAYFTGTMLGTVKFQGIQLSNLALMSGMNWGGIPSLGIAGTIDVSSFSSSIALFFDSNDPSKSVFAGATSDISLKDIALVMASAKKIPNHLEKVLGQVFLAGTGSFVIPHEYSEALDNLEIEKVSEVFLQRGKIRIPATQEQVLLVVKKRGELWSLTDLYDQMKHYQLQKSGKGIEVTLNAQIYSSPQYTRIGTLSFSEGFFMNGALSILGLTSTTKVEISRNKGIAVDTHLNKALTIYKKEFFQLKAATKDQKGPSLSISTFIQRNHPLKEFRNPHLYINGQLYLMGMENICYVSLTTKGFYFYLSETQDTALKIKEFSGKVRKNTALSGNFGDIQALEARAENSLSYDVKIDFANLGKLKFQSKVAGAVEIGYDGKKAYAHFAGSFQFQNENYSVKAELNVSSKDLANIAEVISREVLSILRQGPFQDAEKWAKWAKNSLLEGIDDIDKVSDQLRQHFGQSSHQAAKILRGSGYNMNDIGSSLKNVYKVDSKEMKSALKYAGYADSSIDKYVSSSYKTAAKQVNKTTKKAKKKAKKAKKKAKKAFK